MMFKWIAIGVGGVIAISVGAAVLKTTINTATLPMQVINKTMTADNVIQKYEWFWDAYGVFKTRANQIQIQKAALSKETDSAERFRLNVELRGLQSVCMNLANQYNANATKTNQSIFMGREAPSMLNPADCQ